jgi:glyoxylase-like metal-dependent hydrolase (beta-lactamase superfamily II)
VDGVLLTHSHMGHYLGLAFFGYEVAHTDRVPVYCTPSLAGWLAANGPWNQLVRLENINLKRMEHELQVWFTHLNRSNLALDEGAAAIREMRRRGFGVVKEGQSFPP